MFSLGSGNTASGSKKIYIGPRYPNSFKRLYDSFLGQRSVESNHTNDNVAISNQSAASVESQQTNDESLGNFFCCIIN